MAALSGDPTVRAAVVGGLGAERAAGTMHIRACTNCVRAKAKCSPAAAIGEVKCDRCLRMNKVCQPSPPVRRHRASKKHAHETSKLEEKLDGLVTLLKSAAQAAPGSLNAGLINSALNTSPNAHHETSYTQNPAPDRVLPHLFQSSGSPPSFTNFTTTDPPKPPNIFPTTICPSPDEATRCLERFRSSFVRHLPFVYISPSTTQGELHQDRPFLWASIMAVATNNSAQQDALSKEMRVIIAREAYIEGTRNIDLLLAILVYATWDRRFCFMGKPLLIALIQLAIAILYDLGLDKSPPKDPALLLAYELKGMLKAPVSIPTAPTLEGRRAFLGLFVASSVSCSVTRKGSALPWTSYANECLQVIEFQNELDSDAALIQVVKIRQIFERVKESPWWSPTSELDSVSRTPGFVYLSSLEAQVRNLKAQLPFDPERLDNKTLQMEIIATEVAIYEIGLSSVPGMFIGHPTRRIDCLWSCVNLLKTWTETYLDIPTATYVGFSSLTYSNMLYVLIVMYRLSMFEHAEWDRSIFREHVSISSLLDACANNFASVRMEAGLDIDGSDVLDSFSIMASRTRTIRASWDIATGLELDSDRQQVSDDIYDFPIDFSSEDWLRDMLGSSYL